MTHARARWLTTGLMAVVLLTPLLACDVGTQDRPGPINIRERYTKHEYRIAMRDGVELHTTVYAPTDTTAEYPFLLNRTPYSCGPYGEGRYPGQIVPSLYLVDEGYIDRRELGHLRHDRMAAHQRGAA